MKSCVGFVDLISLYADNFFSKLTFSKNNFRNSIRVSNSLDPDLSVLIRYQTVYKDYQQMTKVSASKERV